MDNNIRELERQLTTTGDPVDHQRLLCAKQRAGVRRLIGVSLSFGVNSILLGDVQLPEVKEIISNTTGFVLYGPIHRDHSWRGPNYQAIFDQYLEGYWYDHERKDKTADVEAIVEKLLPRINERRHGHRWTWVDADSPYEWGKVSQGPGEGVVGTYINPRTNEIHDTPASIKADVDRWG
jgi:hypothetical protein